MPEKDAFVSLLLQQKELIFQLLRVTNDTVLSKARMEDNAENYIELVETRDELIVKLKKLNEEVENIQKPTSLSGEAAILNQEMKEMKDHIARLEPEVRKKALSIMTHLRQEIRGINTRKKINIAYEAVLSD